MKKALAVLTFSVLYLPLPSGETARAHSWYPPECCHDRDCAPTTKMTRLPGGSYLYTTKFGEAEITPQTSIRESRDERVHACIREQKLVCIFFPPIN